MDQEIIRLLRVKDEAGLALLRQKYGGMIAYVLRGILPDARDREECREDVILQVWNKFGQYNESRGSLSPWITAISRNAAINFQKKNRPVEPLDGEVAVLESPEDYLVRRETSARLMEAVDRLSPVDRKLFYRKYYYCQSLETIAAETGMTLRAAEGRIYRMRRKLAGWMGVEFQ